tara:strand:- start:43260 stop:43697 length:438 start_codon:yes stop_codon:yes gene_type:complete
MDKNCIFCDISSKKIPAHIIYEDELIMAILDQRPTRQGHTLIIPKVHVDYFMNLDKKLATHIVLTGNKLAKRMMGALKPTPLRVGFVVHGAIPHVHYHILPQYEETDITSGTMATCKDGKVVFDHELIPVANDKEQQAMVKLLSM